MVRAEDVMDRDSSTMDSAWDTMDRAGVPWAGLGVPWAGLGVLHAGQGCNIGTLLGNRGLTAGLFLTCTAQGFWPLLYCAILGEEFYDFFFKRMTFFPSPL